MNPSAPVGKVRYPRLLTLLCLCVSSIAATTRPARTRPAIPAERPPIELRNVNWQALPPHVKDAFVGPDGRVWYSVGGSSAPSPDALRRLIEREFLKRSPQIDGASVILFEPTGRVWFVDHAGWRRTIIGYDGRTWTERPLQGGHLLVGSLPNHGTPDVGGHNAFVGGAAFFPTSHGVECFDGKEWSFLDMGPRAQWPRVPFLRVEPDGNGVIALLAAKQPVLRRWRDGKWNELPAPADLGRFMTYAPVEDGIWLLGLEGHLRFHPYDPTSGRGLDAALRQLTDPDPTKRDEATGELLKMGPPIIPRLEAALAEAHEAETIGRLQEILVKLRQPGSRLPSHFGPYQLHDVRWLHYLPDRTIVAPAGNVLEQGNPRGPGVVFRSPTGKFKFLPGEANVRLWPRYVAAGGYVAIDDTRAWFPARPGELVETTLADLRTGRAIATVPGGRFRHVRGATGDILFVSGRSPDNALFAYRPDAPPAPNLIRAQAIPVGKIGVGIASDGAVWANLAGKGLCRFDGNEWHPLDLLNDRSFMHWCLPGRKGQMLLRSDREYHFLGKDNLRLTGKDLRELIKGNADVFRDAFLNAPRGNGWGTWTNLVGDKAGNLWLLENRRLTVLTEQGWQDTQLALTAVGSADGTVRYLSAVGDGSRVYVTDFERTGVRKFSGFGEVRAGKVLFTPGPITSEALRMEITVRESDGGALWVPGVWSDSSQGDVRGGMFPHRVSERGVTASPRDVGWPRLADGDGNVWFAGTHGSDPFTELNVWRDGKISAKLKVRAEDRSTFFSDAPGSVYLWSDSGLHHFVARRPGDPSSFALDTTHAVVGLSFDILRVEYSSLGFIVVTTEGGLRDPRFYLHLIPLPRK